MVKGTGERGELLSSSCTPLGWSRPECQVPPTLERAGREEGGDVTPALLTPLSTKGTFLVCLSSEDSGSCELSHWESQ